MKKEKCLMIDDLNLSTDSHERELGETSANIESLRRHVHSLQLACDNVESKLGDQEVELSKLKTRLTTAIAVGFALLNIGGFVLSWVRTMSG